MVSTFNISISICGLFLIILCNSTYAQLDITNASNITQQIEKNGVQIYDTDYCQKNMSVTAQRVCGKTDLLCREHKGENEFWDGFCKAFPEELNKIK